MTLEELREVRDYFQRSVAIHDNAAAASAVESLVHTFSKTVCDLAEAMLMLEEMCVGTISMYPEGHDPGFLFEGIRTGGGESPAAAIRAAYEEWKK